MAFTTSKIAFATQIIVFVIQKITSVTVITDNKLSEHK